MRAALYARVSTDAQQARGTIGSQLELLRERVTAEGDELVAEFRDDGHSGARLDRPGLDALRDAAEAGLIEAVWCVSPDRLARIYTYQVIVLDELARHGVSVRFTDAPPLPDDLTPGCSPRSRAPSPSMSGRRSLSVTGGGSCSAPALGRCSPGAPPTATGGCPAARPARRGLRSSSPKPRWSGRSSTTTWRAGTRSARSCSGWLPARSPHPPAAARSGAPPRSAGCSATRPTSAGSTSTGSRQCPTRGRENGPGRCPARGKSGSPSPCRRSWPGKPSRPPAGSAGTTATGVPAGPSRASGCCAAWSNAEPAAWHQLP
jgi:hypothetical protein